MDEADLFMADAKISSITGHFRARAGEFDAHGKPVTRSCRLIGGVRRA
jgi:hypothetical protein